MVALNEQRLLFNGNKLRSMTFRSGHDPQLLTPRTQLAGDLGNPFDGPGVGRGSHCVRIGDRVLHCGRGDLHTSVQESTIVMR